MPNYFGTDGIRGKSPEFLNIKIAYRIGFALGDGLKAKTLYIGRDTRYTSLELNQALSQGAKDSGVNVINLGVISTPLIAYLSKKHKVYGAMITASHNPASDNGIKIINQGLKSTQDEENIIESYFDKPSPKIFDGLIEDDSLIKDYTDDIKKLPFKNTHLIVILDTANGALFELAPKIINDYANIYKTIGSSPNGININDKVGSTHLESLLEVHEKGMIGLAFDGDGDRLIAVDEQGEIVTGDQILSIIASFSEYITKIALTQMVNPGIKASLLDKGIKVTETPIGDKYIMEALDKEEILIGGEDSGHMIFKKIWPIGDGIISALILLDVLETNGITLYDAKKAFIPYPSSLLNFKHVDGSLLENPSFTQAFDTIKASLTGGKVLLRKSGTESLIRLYASHKDETKLHTFLNKATDLFNSYGGLL